MEHARQSDRVVESEETWPLGLFDCLTFRTSRGGKLLLFPDFFPEALCCTCFVVGQIRTLEERERSIYCGMGMKGLQACGLSTIGGCCCFAESMRAKTLLDYKINDGSSSREKVPAWLVMLCCPCSLFQVLATRRELLYRSRGSTFDTETLNNMTQSPFMFENSEKRSGPGSSH